jgi:hypothetical protein
MDYFAAYVGLPLSVADEFLLAEDAQSRKPSTSGTLSRSAPNTVHQVISTGPSSSDVLFLFFLDAFGGPAIEQIETSNLTFWMHTRALGRSKILNQGSFLRYPS